MGEPWGYLKLPSRSQVDIIKDIKNKLDDGSGEITFTNYCFAMEEQNPDNDEEAFYKETFRTFSKDKDGCIPPDEMRFVFQYLGVS